MAVPGVLLRHLRELCPPRNRQTLLMRLRGLHIMSGGREILRRICMALTEGKWQAEVRVEGGLVCVDRASGLSSVKGWTPLEHRQCLEGRGSFNHVTSELSLHRAGEQQQSHHPQLPLLETIILLCRTQQRDLSGFLSEISSAKRTGRRRGRLRRRGLLNRLSCQALS